MARIYAEGIRRASLAGPLGTARAQIVRTLTEIHEHLSKENILPLLEDPPDSSRGDIALPCFKLRDVFPDRDPPGIASYLDEHLPLPDLFESTQVAGPYLNFFLDRDAFLHHTVDHIRSEPEAWGRLDAGEEEPVVIDYSSPNIAKPFSVGHLRSTAIGACLHRLYDRLGFEAIGVNHLGDWGTQCGKQLLAFDLWGDEETLQEEGIDYLQELYVRVNREIEKKEDLAEQAREWQRKLEREEEEAIERWKQFRQISLSYLDRIYDRLGVSFDHYRGESHYREQAYEVVEEAKAAGITKESEGALVVPFEEEDLPPFLLLKEDGSTLYSTRDLAAALDRHREFHADRLLYVVAGAQTLHFRQLFRTLEKMGHDWVEKSEHVRFGLVQFEGGKMSTRKGDVVLLEDLLERGMEKTEEIMEDRAFDEEKKEELAREIGLAAVLFSDLKNDRIKDYEFDWDRALGYDENTGSFRGETGPYLQYTHVRLCGIDREIDRDPDQKLDVSLLEGEEEFDLVKLTARYPNILVEAARENDPSRIATYLIDLAQAFNAYYHDRERYRIVSDDPHLTAARYALCTCIKHTLSDGLRILGIEPLERM